MLDKLIIKINEDIATQRIYVEEYSDPINQIDRVERSKARAKIIALRKVLEHINSIKELHCDTCDDGEDCLCIYHEIYSDEIK